MQCRQITERTNHAPWAFPLIRIYIPESKQSLLRIGTVYTNEYKLSEKVSEDSKLDKREMQNPPKGGTKQSQSNTEWCIYINMHKCAKKAKRCQADTFKMCMFWLILPISAFSDLWYLYFNSMISHFVITLVETAKYLCVVLWWCFFKK